MTSKNELLQNIEKLHTTPMGAERIAKNLGLGAQAGDPVLWCRKRIESPQCDISRKGKNWYCLIDGARITVNAYSCTIITAHRI